MVKFLLEYNAKADFRRLHDKIKDIVLGHNNNFSMGQFIESNIPYHLFAVGGSYMCSTTRSLYEFIAFKDQDAFTKLRDLEQAAITFQDFCVKMKTEKSAWLPISYALASIMTYYCYNDISRIYSKERDPNINRTIARQVFKDMQYVLPALIKIQDEEIKKGMYNKIEKGVISVVEEMIFIKDYYYIDLDGRRHRNFNSESERDREVEKYVSSNFQAYKSNPERMSKAMEEIINTLQKFSVFTDNK